MLMTMTVPHNCRLDSKAGARSNSGRTPAFWDGMTMRDQHSDEYVEGCCSLGKKDFKKAALVRKGAVVAASKGLATTKEVLLQIYSRQNGIN